jgi:hypothetical protein
MRDFALRCGRWYAHNGLIASLRKGIESTSSRRSPGWRAYRNWNTRTLPQLTRDIPDIRLNGAPMLSVICPVHNGSPRLLNSLYASVRIQEYARWELCFLDDASKLKTTRDALDKLQRGDRRIKLETSETSLGISGASNAAARMARGEVFVFLDHDDELAPGVFLKIAQAFLDNPGLALVYTDEDQLTEWGLPISPNFKPGPSPYLELGFNYVGHLVAITRSLFDELGGMRREFEGSQDHDLVLRAFERDREIRHLPGIGYHWRRARGSVADTSTAKTWAFEAGRRAVEAACKRRELPIKGVNTTTTPGVYELIPRPLSKNVECWVVVHGDIQRAMQWRSLLLNDDSNCGLTIRGFSVNEWPTCSSGSDLLVINVEIEPSLEVVESLLRWSAMPGVGAVSTSACANSRRRDHGWSITRKGFAQPILPGHSLRGKAPGLLSSVTREIAAAAGGIQWIAAPNESILNEIAGAPVSSELELAISAAGALEGLSTLFVPFCHPRWQGSRESFRRSRPIHLLASGDITDSTQSTWARILDSLPENFWNEGADRYCPRHELLVRLGLPAPLHSKSHTPHPTPTA